MSPNLKNINKDTQMTNVIQIGQHQYIHVLDENTIITRLECGPQTFVKKAHEKIVRGCTPMIEVHPRHFCRIQNPVVIGEDGDPEMTPFNQVKVKHGETEIRFHRNKPFPLFPGEKLLG